MPAPVHAAHPPQVSLTGADCFLRAFDAEIGRFNRASHISQLVLRLGPGFDVEHLRTLVHEAARAQPILRAPVRRRFGIGAPVYQLAAASGRPNPPLEVEDVGSAPVEGQPLPTIFERRLNERRSLRRGELLRFDVVRYGGGALGTDVAMSWLHLLFDGSGSEHFVHWLDDCFGGARRVDELPNPGEFDPPELQQQSARERGDAARDWQRWLNDFRAHPVHSLAGPRTRSPQALRCDVLTLDESETEQAVARAGRLAGFLTPMLFYLAATIRAHHAVYALRGAVPGSYVVPLPVNVRPRGGEAAIFRTHVSLLWFQVTPAQVEDLSELIGELKSQRLAAIKAGYIEKGIHAMDFARFAPAPLYTYMARRSFSGELCSFFFAYTGEFLSGLERFLGAEVRNAFHVAPVPPSPGSCAAMSLRGGRLNVTHVHQAGIFSDAERSLFRASLRADLVNGA
jgi:hypothetical protein